MSEPSYADVINGKNLLIGHLQDRIGQLRDIILDTQRGIERAMRARDSAEHELLAVRKKVTQMRRRIVELMGDRPARDPKTGRYTKACSSP